MRRLPRSGRASRDHARRDLSGDHRRREGGRSARGPAATGVSAAGQKARARSSSSRTRSTGTRSSRRQLQGASTNRPIVLADWQRAVVDGHREQFLRGLIHSDGCRVINRFKTKLPSARVAEYEYPRYFFSNLSADIRGLFCEYCERLGVRWTQSNHRNVSVSHRGSVAILDAFIGPKR